METSGRPTPSEAAAALLGAASARDQLSRRLKLPSWFHISIGLAITGQIATLAVGVSDQSSAGIALAVAGLVPFLFVAGVQLVRFRRLNGVWVSGLASRVVLGGDSAASSVYVLAMGAAIWAGFGDRWRLVGLCAIAGGVGYALCGSRWLRSYRDDPAAHSRREPGLLLFALGISLVGGAAVLAMLGAR
jgi:hypothetical protein